MPEAHSQWDIVSHVGLTALAVAAARSIESHRDDPLVRDPFAEDLVLAASPPEPMPTRPVAADGPDPEHARAWTELADLMGLRTRFFDEFFERAARSGATQAVILASGLDTRAFRMTWPSGFRVFEIDQPQVLDFKDRVLDDVQPRCARRVVGVDLRDDWAGELGRSGFDPAQPTAWLAEGLLRYLPAEAEQRLLETIHQQSAPGSSVSLSFGPRRQQRDSATMSLISRNVGVDVRSLSYQDARPDPGSTLEALGWTSTSTTLAELAEHFQHQPRIPGEPEMNLHFCTAELPH